MGPVLAGVLQLLALMAALTLAHVPLGDYMARVYSSDRHWRARWPACAPTPSPGGSADTANARWMAEVLARRTTR